MHLTRRQFFPCFSLLAAERKPLTLDCASLEKFVDRLPIPPIAKSLGQRPVAGDRSTAAALYRVPMNEIWTKVHRDLPPTRVWSYGDSWPGPTIETRSGDGVIIDWVNQLPSRHFLPIDHNICGAEADKPEVRTVVHVHGSRAPAGSDGYPENWYVPGRSATSYYPNQQEATTLWYHDHAMGITRLNAYAGLFGFYMVRDDFEDGLRLPGGKFEIPLILCDRSFTPAGQLFYPVSEKPGAPWVPEVFGDAILANGKLFPFAEVEPRKYRLRLLNASNGRFCHVSLSSGQDLVQIGSDQGLLAAPAPRKRIALAPGERADIVIDFGEARGGRIVLRDGPLDILQFRVSSAKVADHSDLPSRLRPVARIPESAAVNTRMLTLGETDNMVAEPMVMLLNKTHWAMPVTEKPRLNSVEIWSFINLTEDSHPIHLHLVRFQILDRRKIDAFAYQTNGDLRYFGPATPPEPGEGGWKDTVRTGSKQVTRIIVPFAGYTGRYVWHCHIAEHEDNEMMRPYEVLPADS